jgi:hypothetical protein
VEVNRQRHNAKYGRTSGEDDYDVRMIGSASTILQLFVVEAMKGLPRGMGVAVRDAAYDASEEPTSPDTELQRYYALCDRATAWCEAALHKIRLGDYAGFVAQGRGWGRDGAATAEQTLRTALFVIGEEPYASVPDQTFIQAARKTILETIHALGVASRVTDPRAERSTLRTGTAAAARAFVAASGFIGAPPEEARATVTAMRDVSAAVH